jgi:hypothetical protein
MDLNGDGSLEIVVQTFGEGCFVYTVPGSAENLLLWPTGRGNYLRDGRPWSNECNNDMRLFAKEFGRTDCGEASACTCDMDRDGDVDGQDLAAF